MRAATRGPYDWSEIWHRHLTGYLSAEPRAGLMIMRTLSGNFNSVLEIACGSARDSSFLQSVGKEVVASDSNIQVISELQRRFETYRT
jgi:Tellurite resistance protein TehB